MHQTAPDYKTGSNSSQSTESTRQHVMHKPDKKADKKLH